MKSFSTPLYQGHWFQFSNDRMGLRIQIEALLRLKWNDPSGFLEVDALGPHWRGKPNHHLSYSHTEGAALLVYSTTHAIGVDVERKDRAIRDSAIKIAKRYFHEHEVALLLALQKGEKNEAALHEAFMDLWLKKEALGKLLRSGLKESIHVEVATQSRARFETLPVCPVGFEARIAIEMDRPLDLK